MNVTLGKLRDEDSDLLFRWINTPELVKLSSPFSPVSREAHDRWFATIRSARDHRIYSIVVGPGERVIGYCQLRRIDRVSLNAELQIRIGEPNLMGRGIGSAAVAELLGIAFKELELVRVYLHVIATNERARRTYLKCGFKEEGWLREAVRIDNRFEDVVMMGILAREMP